MEKETAGKGTHVVREDVQRAVVGVCLLLEAVPNVVLGDEVARERVQAAGEEAGHEQVDKRVLPTCRDKDVVEDELRDEVREVPLREGLRAHEARAEGVEEDLECAVKKMSARSRKEGVEGWRTQRRLCLERC